MDVTRQLNLRPHFPSGGHFGQLAADHVSLLVTSPRSAAGPRRSWQKKSAGWESIDRFPERASSWLAAYDLQHCDWLKKGPQLEIYSLTKPPKVGTRVKFNACVRFCAGVVKWCRQNRWPWGVDRVGVINLDELGSNGSGWFFFSFYDVCSDFVGKLEEISNQCVIDRHRRKKRQFIKLIFVRNYNRIGLVRLSAAAVRQQNRNWNRKSASLNEIKLWAEFPLPSLVAWRSFRQLECRLVIIKVVTTERNKRSARLGLNLATR